MCNVLKTETKMPRNAIYDVLYMVEKRKNALAV